MNTHRRTDKSADNPLKQDKHRKGKVRQEADHAHPEGRRKTTDETATHQGGSHKGGGKPDMDHPSQKGGVKKDLDERLGPPPNEEGEEAR